MSVTEQPLDLTLDLRGRPNPESILGLAEASNTWRAGDTIRVLADDECFANDFLRWHPGCELDLMSLRELPNGDTELTIHMRRPLSTMVST